MKKALRNELRKLDRVGVLTLKRQMEIAEWMYHLIDEGADYEDMAAKMRVDVKDIPIFMTGAKSFRLSHIAGLTALKHEIDNRKKENQIITTKE